MNNMLDWNLGGRSTNRIDNNGIMKDYMSSEIEGNHNKSNSKVMDTPRFKNK